MREKFSIAISHPFALLNVIFPFQENIVFARNGDAKFIDFGSSLHIPEDDISRTPGHGKQLYMSDESISGNYSYPADMWRYASCFGLFNSNSLGVVFLEVLCSPEDHESLRMRLENSKKVENDMK